MTDIPVATSPTRATAFLHEDETTLQSPSFDTSSRESFDDLDVEDPLSRVYIRDEEFESFSPAETGFISVSCAGVVLVPLVYLLVAQLSAL